MDKLDPDSSTASVEDEIEEAGGYLVIPRGDAPLFLETAEEAFDA